MTNLKLFAAVVVLSVGLLGLAYADHDCPYVKGGSHATYTNGVVISDGFEPIRINAIWTWNGTHMVREPMPLELYARITAVRNGVISLWRVIWE